MSGKGFYVAYRFCLRMLHRWKLHIIYYTKRDTVTQEMRTAETLKRDVFSVWPHKRPDCYTLTTTMRYGNVEWPQD